MRFGSYVISFWTLALHQNRLIFRQFRPRTNAPNISYTPRLKIRHINLCWSTAANVTVEGVVDFVRREMDGPWVLSNVPKAKTRTWFAGICRTAEHEGPCSPTSISQVRPPLRAPGRMKNVSQSIASMVSSSSFAHILPSLHFILSLHFISGLQSTFYTDRFTNQRKTSLAFVCFFKTSL